MLILCKDNLGEADFDRLGKKLAALPYPMRWSRRRGRLAILMDRANSAEPDLKPVIDDPAVEYVLRAPSEDEVGRVFSRRDLLHFSLASTGIIAGAALFAPVGLYLAAPAGERTATGDFFIAPAEGKGGIPVGGTRSKMIDGEEYLVVRREEDRYHAVSRTCTHSGVCLVDWDSKRQQFVCPCHKGAYDLYGNVMSGPPPRPLKSRDVEVRDGRVYVKRERPA
jgi:cytochrome b6-f complex iron-sulfur subunit